MSLTDKEIIDLYFDRDEKAIEETDRKYNAYCSVVAGNILQNDADTEECISDTWLNAWNSIPPQRPNILKAYLAKIARNLAINRYNAAHAQKRGNGEYELALDELAEITGLDGDPMDELLADDLKEAVGAFIKELPTRDAYYFTRRYFFTEGVKEIAKRYGTTENAVSVSLSRNRKKLAERLKDKGYI